MTATTTWESLLEGARQAAEDTARAVKTHHAEHYLPEPAAADEAPTINSLTDADGQPAVKFGPDIVALVAFHKDGIHAQILGVPNVDPMALGEALVDTGRRLLDAEDGNPPYTPERRVLDTEEDGS